MSEIIRAKWTMDGAATLPEAAAKLREKAAELDRMHAEGWRLEGPVEDDYGSIYGPGSPPDEPEDDVFDDAEATALLEAEGGQE